MISTTYRRLNEHQKAERPYTIQTGILTLDDPILPEESIDPFDSLPRLSPELMTPPAIPEVFSVIKDGGLTPSENYVYGLL